MEKVLLEKNELDTIKEIQQTEIDLIDQFGRIEFQVQTLLLQKEELKQEIAKLKIASNKLGGQLQQKYGDGNINMETGEFIKID